MGGLPIQVQSRITGDYIGEERLSGIEWPMRISALIAILLLASCAQAFEGRVAGRLTYAGIPGGMSNCMAKHWVKRLSVLQLRKIQRLTNDITRDRGAGRLTVFRFVARMRAVDDPEIFDVVVKSATACALNI